MAEANSTSLENYTPEQRDELAKLAKDLADNPATRKEFLRLTKKHSPNTPIPEIDLEADLEKVREKDQKEREALQQRVLQGEVRERIREARDKLRRDGHTEDEITAIEKKMVDEKIPTYDTAAKYFRLEKQSAQPTPASVVHTNKMPVDGKMLKEAGGIKKWGQNEAHAAISDLRSGKVKFTH